MLGQINDFIANFQKENGREPSLEETAESLEIHPDSLQAIMKLRESILSLDEVTPDGASLLESIPCDAEHSALDQAQDHQRESVLSDAMQYLTERERQVVRYRYGFENGNPLSLRHTSRYVGLSQEGVRRIERKALEKLRRPAIAAKIAGLL
ncbi:MAG: RNA polymerase sigma factor SigA [candidate division BRC1 bacterium ADurb.BinA364]|nr:MAG: RNA polymerase sigma factor SigA [candidate division BRC1 bacterium ADurb.BinA364]